MMRHRRAARPLAVAALLMAAAGCSVQIAGTAAPAPAASVTVAQSAPPPAPYDAGARYADAAGRVWIIPPRGWKVGVRAATVNFISPTVVPSSSGPFAPNINVGVSRFDGDLAAAIRGARSELQGISGYTSTGETDVVLSDGTPAHLIGGTFTDPGSGRPIRNVQLFTVHGGSAIFATGTVVADGWDAYAGILESSLRSLTVTP